VVGDYFSIAGNNYLVLGDRFFGWLSIYTAGKGEFDAKSLVTKSRDYFTNFNIPEEIATDGGPQMMSDVFKKSLKVWGIRHRLSSAYNPHSNCRAELALKTGKKMLRDNMGHGGSIYTDKVMRAVLQYRNTPMQDSRRSPAQMVFGRQMRDFIPSLTYKYEPAKDWAVSQEHRERTLANKREMDHQRWSYRTKDLDELEVGTAVAIQNQRGQNPTKWEKTGIIIENKPNSKVMIRVNGSRLVTLRNRRFVRPMETTLRTTTRQAPARRKMTTPPTIRQEQTREPLPSCPRVDVEKVAKVPAEVREEIRDDRFEEVHDTEEAHHEVDIRQDDAATRIPDDVQAGRRAEQDQEGQFEAAPDVKELNEGSTRPRRVPKPNSRYSPEDYDLNYMRGTQRNKSRTSP
jgi:hypothetical protein